MKVIYDHCNHSHFFTNMQFETETEQKSVFLTDDTDREF